MSIHQGGKNLRYHFLGILFSWLRVNPANSRTDPSAYCQDGIIALDLASAVATKAEVGAIILILQSGETTDLTSSVTCTRLQS